MKRKILLAATALLIMILTFTSCEGLFGDNTDTPPAEEKVKLTQIVIENADTDIISVRSDIFDITGMIGTVLPTEPATEGEIIFGNTNRPATLAAKAELERIIAEDGTDAGYIIYYDGKSVAIYWQDARLSSLAIAKFEKICIDEKKLELEKGVIDKGTFTTASLERDAMWLAIEASATPEVYTALKAWANNFNGRQISEWLANLWDPEIGGFYYSNSARDNEPYRPDLESVYQTLSWLTGNGAIKSVNQELPEEMRAQIVAFVKSTQSSTEGYFLHPQWGTSYKQLNLDRYGRDLSWGVSILKQIMLDTNGDGVLETQYPNYCTPSGFKCEEHSKNGGLCSIVSSTASYIGTSRALTAGISSSVSAAVSKIPSSTVKAVASSSPDYSSEETFLAWLEAGSPNVKENSGDAHVINALQDEIISKGYCDVLLDFLEQAQNEVYEEQVAAGQTPSGLWQYTPNYRAVWGIHKYSVFYSSGKRSMQYHKEMVASCIEVILSEANGSYAMNDMMNQWTAIGAVKNNAKLYNPDDLDEIEAMLSENAVAMINQTILKLEDFAIGDGMYGYTVGGKSLATIYGVPISHGVKEADVNGQLLLGSCYRAIFSAFGYNAVPLCTTDDGKNFVDIIKYCEPIEKAPLPKPETIDFEDKDLSDLKNVVLTKRSDAGEIVITDDPLGEHEKVLFFNSGAATGDRADDLDIKVSSTGGNCNIAEFDMYVANSTSGSIIQLKMGNSFLVTIARSGDYLTMQAWSKEAGTVKEQLVSTDDKIRANEWHTFRFEVYNEDYDGAPVIKVFIDGELIKNTNLHYNYGSAYNSTYAKLNIYSMKSAVTELYFDNVFVNRETKIFDAESDDVSDSRGL
ncbi:MAG: hypothetical protein IJW03_03405 [Clostridia bacterium]|nr:hypothetical protein [Clostridia bacterium]